MIRPRVVDFEVGIPSSHHVHPTKSPKRELMFGGSEGEDRGWTHRAAEGSRGGGEEGEEAGVDGRCGGRWRAAGVDGELLDFCYILSRDDAIIV
jgi:hypothetical protein